MQSAKKKAPVAKKGEKSAFKSFLYTLRKKRIIEILAGFIGGGWLILEFVHWILIDHYHFPEESLDITIVTLTCALICTLTWRIFAGAKKSARKVKLELILIPLFILITAFFDVSLIQQIGEAEAEEITQSRWKNSIAVLPFVNIGAEEEQEYFCDGLTEELINRLSNIKELKVPSHTSSFAFKGEKIDIREVGEKLNVDKVLEGSVRKTENRIRITAQLINITDGYHLWSQKYDRNIEDVFAIQDEISLAIVNKLKVKLIGREEGRLTKHYTENLKAYNSYLRGRWFWNRRTSEDLKKAITYFEKAIEEESDYALAYVGLADCYNLISVYGNVPTKESFPRAKEAALKAIALDETLGEAHNSLAYGTYQYYWDFAEAAREFKRAIDLNPNYATAHFWYGEFLMTQGRFDEAFSELNIALELDPVSLIINSFLGDLYSSTGQPEKAVEQFLKTLEMDPNFPLAHSILGIAYTDLNKFPEAIAEGKKAVEISGGSINMSYLGWIYAQAGKDEEAKKIIEELQELSRKYYVSSFWIANIYMGLGDNDKAFEWLEKAYEERCESLVYSKAHTIFNPIRTDPSYSELLKKIGLE